MKENRKRLLSLFLVAVLLFGILPTTSYASDGEPLRTKFVCEEAAPLITVYNAAGEMIAEDAGGYYALTPGSYFYSAEAEGFESLTMQPFNVPENAEGDQELLFTMMPVTNIPDSDTLVDLQDTEDAEDAEEEENPQAPLEPAPEDDETQAWTGGVFAAHYSKYQAFDVQRSPAYPTGTQESPDTFTVKELASPVGVGELGEEDYFYFVGLGPASQTGVLYSDSWNAPAEGLDPFTVSLHVVRDGADSELARGVIGAFSEAGFLFAADGYGTWFSNTKGYRYTSESVSYNPATGGRLVCDAGLLTGCMAQSMLEPDPDVPDHVHNWTSECDGAAVVFRCEEAGCPYGTNEEYSYALNIPAFVYHAESVEASVEKSVNDEEWPAELEQNVICYVGRGGTEYGESMIPPTAVGTYTARVSVGYRLNPQILEADFSIVKEIPVPFNQTQSANGVVVTVRAEAGVFPADAVLFVAEASVDEAVKAAVAAEREQELAPAASASVEIQIINSFGEVLQPSDGHRVSVTLSLAEPANGTLETGVYRIMRDGEGCVTAEAQSVNEYGGSTAVVETDGRLCYVLELVRTLEDSPELSYHDVVDGMIVDIFAPAGAFPRGTVVTVTSVQEAEVISAVEAALDMSAEHSSAVLEKKVVNVRALDITFTNEAGEELQPLLPISVSLRPVEVENAALDVAVVHIDAEGVGSEVEDAVNSDGEVTFSAECFSTYVYTSVLVTRVLDSRGDTWEISVEYDSNANIPENALLSVTEILQDEKAVDGATEYEIYLAKTKKALSLETGVFNYVHFFDIKIVDADGVKAEIAAPVEVRMKLADCEHFEEPQIVHFADGAENGDVINAVTLEEETICFETESFSAYAIVDGPEVIPIGWQKVSSIEDLLSHDEGLYLGHPDGYYYMNTLTGDSSRTGITKTKPASVTPPENAAAKYYFEMVEGTDNQVYAYCYAANGAKQYVFNNGNNSLSFTDESQKTAFTVSVDDSGKFKLNNGEWYWNMQGGANGSRFCSYNAPNDSNNSLYIWYKEDVTSDPYDLNGKTYGLMNWNGGVAGKALMANSAGSDSIEAKSLTVMSKADNNSDKLFVPNDSDISMWTFEWVADDKYYLTAGDGENKQYLKIDVNGLSLVNTPDDGCSIQVVPGTGIHAGEIFLKSGDTVLTYSGSIDTGFNISGGAGNEWLHLVDLSELTSDYFMTYSASKVSVSDPSVANGSRVIVYTRSWNDEKKRYDFYAINSDGTLIPVYESGDSIEWVSGQINELLWNFVEYYWDGTEDPNFYYELYNQYSEQYIAPQVSGDQILSDSTIGINMNGRRDGQYYSTILAWDDSNYSFAGLKVEDGKIVSCPRDEAMDFYFAIMQDLNVDDDVHTVPTVDHTAYGITMKIKDFESRAQMSGFLGNDEGGVTTQLVQGLLSTNLGNDDDHSGYPTASGGSLSNLYSGGQEVNHLFIASTYYSSGYFMYDSTQTFASLQEDNNFVVYQELGSYDSGGNKPTLKHGQFFPFNDLKPGVFTSVNTENTHGLSGELPENDPRKHERLYSVENDADKVNCYFGVELEASFLQTPNGLDAWGHDIIFEFTGDDDFWLYVDGELVIDLGGIHSAVPGKVNFRTGEVDVNGTPKKLKDLFYENYIGRGHTAEEAEDYINEKFTQNSDGQWVFKDNTDHTMRIFYMERGAGASNLQMRFNLSGLKAGTVELTKELSGVDSSEEVLAEFPYQILYKTDGEEEHYLKNLIPGSSIDNIDYVIYKDSTKPVEYKTSVTVGEIEYNDVFFLKPGETAEISFPAGMTSYRIIECGVNTDVYNEVMVNEGEEEVTATAEQDYPPNRKDFGINYATTEERARVKFDNSVDQDALRNLTIQKQLYREDGITRIYYPDDETTFTFRLYLATEFDELALANMHTYHVKDQYGNYCRWDSTQQLFVSLGVNEYSQLTDDQKKAASFNTSVYGSISKIPIDYTVEIRNILAGTQFEVQERPTEVPDGYSFQRYDYSGESYTDAWIGVKDIVSADFDPSVVVRNLKGWGLRVNKIWMDADYMSSRDNAYFAVFIRRNGSLELIDDSVKELTYDADPQTLYWYFPYLEQNVSFDEYEIREVKISDTNPTVTPVEDGGKININGMQKGASATETFTYTVTYTKGETTPDSNVRVDTVTNDRPGIIIRKTDWNGEALADAVFILTDEENKLIDTFTSSEDGLITDAFLREGVEYTLKETHAPQAYEGLPAPMTLELSDGALQVEGVGSEYYSLAQEGEKLVLTLKNRPSTLQVIKIDETSKQPMAGATFALHKQVTVGDVTTIDLNPMLGYEALLTGEDGVIIPKPDEPLEAGTYELREVSPPEGYLELSSYIQFTISDTGIISLHDADSAGKLLPEGVILTRKIESDGSVSYVLSIPNQREAEWAEITVMKVWADSDDQDGRRSAVVDAASVQLIKIVNGVESPVEDHSASLPENDGRIARWTNLPKWDEYGNEIKYKVKEILPSDLGYEVDEAEKMVDYDQSVTFTNTHTPETVSISVTKTWDDEDDKDRIRPQSVQVQLYGDGSTIGDPVTLNESNSWQYTWTGLDKNAHGKAIVYTVDETKVPDEYKKTVSYDKGFIITNTHEPKTVNVSGVKVWDDKDDKDQLRPATVTIILLADGVQKDTATISSADNWSWNFMNLPKYTYTVNDDGSVTKTAIVYTVDESTVPNYKKTIRKNSDGTFTITNKHRHSISPKTGDDDNLWLWFAAMILSGYALVTDMLLLRRKGLKLRKRYR